MEFINRGSKFQAVRKWGAQHPWFKAVRRWAVSIARKETAQYRGGGEPRKTSVQPSVHVQLPLHLIWYR
jgi:hypothetical protein